MAGLLRRRRLQLGRHRVRRRRRPGARRVDRRRRADLRPDRGRRPPVRPVPGQRAAGCATRVGEVLGLHYAVPWPNRELDHARDRSGARPCTTGWPARAGCSAAGWAGSGQLLRPRRGTPEIDYTWGKQNWLPWSAARAGQRRAPASPSSTRPRSASTSSAGRDALAALQWVCTADVDVPVGRTVYTGLLNARGTYESDLTVTRTGDAGVPAGQQRRHHRARPGPPAPPRARPGRRRSSTSPPRTPCSA